MTKAAFTDFAFIALGANLPLHTADPADNLKAVLPALQALSHSPLLVSPFYQSDPKDCPPGSPQYINAVVGLLPHEDETPESLLGKLQQLENEFGRVRSGLRNEARTLDLDLLSFKQEVRNTKTLTLPHPRAHERRFVLEPWIALVGKDWNLCGVRLGQWFAENQDTPLNKVHISIGSPGVR